MMFPVQQRRMERNRPMPIRPGFPQNNPSGAPRRPFAKPPAQPPYPANPFARPPVQNPPFPGSQSYGGGETGQFPGKKSVANLTAMFQTPDGQFDIEKIATTAQSINKIYNDVSPMISGFLKNRK
ncbi:hypothetical protein JNUCC1_00156 [Lentibacillus sp. JNUCC-1]|uniref:YppG family protein n=1 Tax=Lentibacillus sp. JNUCC-1 TaxID=2654513 RepID=UPI0012E8F50E|nr:YppG family protein [Lentibacillus sp. JNUCC-1]MUV36354.1 hypothetical protein [Lentibacillus sp. JNUCC-1]